MCGIFGVVYKDGERVPSEECLRRSAELISHRGPDGSGIYREAGIGFAHTRLSLVDLNKRSNQPMWDSEGRHCLVYNGEIYNFRELREHLVDRGVRLLTTSDTEVLLLCLAMDGPEITLPKLEGMFAFAFYDKHKRKLLLARDRFGIKPLVIYEDDDLILFASEVKAMQPWVRLRPNGFRIVSDLMEFGQPARNHHLFEGVKIVSPGSAISFEFGSALEDRKYCDLTDMIDRATLEEQESLSDLQIVDRVDEQLQRSVQRMLFADARVGALCSGGIDSSLIMAIAARHCDNLAIFHANVVGPLSEYDAASLLAKHLKLDLLVAENRDDDFIDLTPDVVYHYEQPFLRHPHSVPFLMVSKLVSENGVKAVLSGEGSDECFLGYRFLAQEPVWEFWARQVDRLERLIHRIPKIGKVLWPTRGRTAFLIGNMLNQFERTLEEQRFRRRYAESLGRPVDRNVRTIDLLAYHLRTILHRNDTMGMAASIEARFPLLDEALVGTAINLPLRHKIRFSPRVWERAHPFVREKWVLRRVADRYLPQELSQRTKRDFAVSAFDRMQVRKEYFKSSFVTDFFRLSTEEFDYLFESADQSLKIRLMMLDVWGQIFIEQMALSTVRERLKRYAFFPGQSLSNAFESRALSTP